MPVPMSAALERLSADLLAAASTRQAVEIRRAMIASTAPAPALIRQSALTTLPRRGGANVWIADAATRVLPVSGARTAGVVVRTRKTGTGISGKGHDLQSVDAGELRHPVYGTWRAKVPATRVMPGFFTRPMRTQLTPVVTAAMAAVMARTAETLTKG